MKLRIHPQAFAAALGTAPPSNSIEGARLMLVEGWTCLAAAKQLGISHQVINRKADAIRKRLERGILCPCCGEVRRPIIYVDEHRNIPIPLD